MQSLNLKSLADSIDIIRFISQTGVTFIRRGKRLAEIGQIITVTSQIHGGPHKATLACVQVWPSRRAEIYPPPPPPPQKRRVTASVLKQNPNT